MKALRGLKKRKAIPIEDPQRIAQEKLAILSDEAFIYTAEDQSGSESWTISSFNMGPRSNHELNLQDPLEAKTLKLKQKTPSNMHNKNRPSLSEQLFNENQLKKYFRLEQDEKMKKNVSSFFPERKSLSLSKFFDNKANYILFDKRKPNSKQQEKSPTIKYDGQRLKLLQLKKMIISRRNKRKLSSDQRLNQSQTQTRHPSPHNSSSKLQISKPTSYLHRQQIDEQQLIMPKNSKSSNNSRSFSEAETILQSIIKRKEMLNINLKRYNRQYEMMKEKVEKARMVEQSINSTKIKLHDYYKRFVY